MDGGLKEKKMNINIEIKGQQAHIVNQQSLISGTSNLEEIKFDFSSEWNGYTKTAVIYVDDYSISDSVKMLVEKDVVSELTYDEIDKSIENLWSVLFTTGYLTHKGCTESGKYRLVIPNKEVRNLFVKKIREWFSDVSRNDGKTLEEFCSAFVDKDSEKIEQIFGDYLWNTISIRDTAVAKEKKENFYHGILLGILSYKGGWYVTSNRESGDGFSDIMVRIDDEDVGIIIEVKYAENGKEEEMSRKALLQIHEKHYEKVLLDEDIHKVMNYGIACNKKKCKVSMEISK